MSDRSGEDDSERRPRRDSEGSGRRDGQPDRRSSRPSAERSGGYRGSRDGQRPSSPRRDGDFRPRREGDAQRPRREGDFRPRREGDAQRPRREGDFRPRREGEFRPRREGDAQRPRREGDFRPRREGDAQRPRRDGDFRARRDGEFRPRREGDAQRPRREGDFRPRREGDAQRPRRDGDFRARRDGDASRARRDGDASRPRRDGAPARGGRESRFDERKPFDRQRPEELKSVRPRHDDPEIPESVTARDLDGAARAELRTLSKDNAEEVARHLVMVGRLIDEDPELAHRHALSAGRRAGRVGVVRETIAITAYATGDFALALRELRTYRRISGKDDQLPLMVDSERGVGRPERALELGRSVDRTTLPNEVQASLAIAMSGARLDLGQPELALAELEVPQLDPNVAYPWSPALFQAYGDVLEELGRTAEAQSWWDRADHAAEVLDAAAADDELETIAVEVEELELDEDDVVEPEDDVVEPDGGDATEEPQAAREPDQYTAEDEVAELLGETGDENGDLPKPQ